MGYKAFTSYLQNLNKQYNSGIDGVGLTEKGKPMSAMVQYSDLMNQQHQDIMANTTFQRGVNDMQSAGLNPALMYGNGSPAPVSSSTIPSSNDRFNSIVQAMMLPAQLQEISANIENSRSQAMVNRANADNIAQQTRNNKLNADFLESTFNERIKTPGLANEMTVAQTRAVYRNMDKMDSEISLLIKQAATEDEKKTLVYWQGKLAEANAQQIQALLPYEIEFKKAATKAQKAAAAASFTHAAYEQGLIDSGYIDSMADEVKARAHSAEEQAIALEYVNALKTGNITEFLNKYSGGNIPITDGVLGAIMMVTSVLGNVFNGIFK